jgi:hypothetical protein
MGETTTTPLIAWSRAFPATPVQAREARQFLAALVGGRTAADDAVLCLSAPANQAASSPSAPSWTASACASKSPTPAAPGPGPPTPTTSTAEGY